MLFNLEKCKVMHLDFNNPQVDYNMDGVHLQAVPEEKDLEVIANKDVKWEKQCSAVVLKANRILGMIKMIKRNFVNRTPAVILALYKSLVRPHLEYCFPV